MGRDGGDISLPMIAPVDLDAVAPRSDGVVLTEANAARVDCGFAETGTVSDAGVMAICSDDKTRPDRKTVGTNQTVFDSLHRGLPAEPDSESRGTLKEELMQVGAFETPAGMRWKCRFDCGVTSRRRPDEADAVDGITGSGRGYYAKLPEEFETVGQQPFAACLIDGRLHAIGYVSGKTLE